MTPAASLTTERRVVLNRRSRLLAYATTAYNLAEGVVAVTAGAAAGSTALIGFGLDSFVEVSSALVVIWQFRSSLPEDRERSALKLIALSFFALAVWVGVDAAHSLLTQDRAQPSLVGIAIAAASVVVMPALAWAKRRVGHELASATVVADSVQTTLCSYLSLIVLGGFTVPANTGTIPALVGAGDANGSSSWSAKVTTRSSST